MQSTVLKRSVIIGKHKTSVSLEDQFWTSLEEIAASRHSTRSDLVAEIKRHRQGNLSSAIRLFVLHFYQEQGGQGA